MSRFVMTMEDDATAVADDTGWSDDEELKKQPDKKNKKNSKKNKNKQAEDEEKPQLDLPASAINPEFEFDEDLEVETGMEFAAWDSVGGQDDVALNLKGAYGATSDKIADIIATKEDDFVSSDEEDEDEDAENNGADAESTSTTIGKRRRVDASGDAPEQPKDNETQDDDGAVARLANEERKNEYFSEAPEGSEAASFAAMNLSRPLIRGLSLMKIETPTLVQQRTIPVALLGRDLCVCASTGSGKTAAFMLPVLERLLFRSKKIAQTRVLVLLPTRELAVQVMQFSKNYGKATDVSYGLAVGGMPLRAQEAELRLRPDVVIATPGRLVDHITNTMSFDLDGIEILILDEADRLLDVGFKDELDVIVKACPRTRQTMLFSATMTDEVEDLVGMSLNEPVRLFVNKNSKVNSNLTQEFVRIRQNRENAREAIVVALCTRVFTKKILVFVNTKVVAHRLRIILGLTGLKIGELHGALTQAQRLEALDSFTKGEIDIMVCTDLAGRGLDIPCVEAVINMHMPHTVQSYIHRVGRTARAGRTGSSVTLVGENERRMLREIIKTGDGNMKSRTVPPKTIEKYRLKINRMKETISQILKEEKEDKELDHAEMEINKAQNLLDHKDEICARPARQWIVSAKKKEEERKKSLESFQGMDQKSRHHKPNLKEEIPAEALFSAREAKRKRKPSKILMHTPDWVNPKGSGKQKKKKMGGGGFETDAKPGLRTKSEGAAGTRNRNQARGKPNKHKKKNKNHD